MEANPYPRRHKWYYKSVGARGYQHLESVSPEINAGIKYFIIQRVELRHAGTYLLNTENTAGTGSFSFELTVQRTYACKYYGDYSCSHREKY